MEEDTSAIEIVDDEDVQTGRGTRVAVKRAFDFSAEILWSFYFTIDKDAKTMTCKLCKKEYPFDKSPKTSAGNQHLYTQKHRQHVLDNMPSGIGPAYWNEER